MWPGQVRYHEAEGLSRIQRDLHQSLPDKSGRDIPGNKGDMFRAAASSGHPPSIAIVGAGLAGLRCADVLLQHGCRVTIFEARNRLGGRVAQSNHLGRSVDLGPNWIHGTNDNPILNIARETETHLHTWDETQRLIGTDGHPIDAQEAAELGRLVWDDGIITQAFRYSNEQHDSIPPDRSLYDFFVEKSRKLFLDEPEDIAKRKRENLLSVATVWGAYVGSHVNRQSLKFFWLEECIEGENPFVSGTYEKILQGVARPASEKATIHLNAKVKAVISGSDPDDKSSPRLQLSQSDGIHAFDEIVVTTPLGWLKNNPSFFQPLPTPRLTQAIQNIGYGSLDKIYATFSTAFWKQDPLGTSASSPSYPSFTHFLPPTYAPQTNPGAWDLQAMDLSALTPPSIAHPTLLFYIYGPCATHIASLVTASASPSALQTSLTAFLQPYISRLPNYSPTDPSCVPTKVFATAWAADELAGYGSYANFPVGLEKGDEDVETLRRGMPERGVWLAGEHTAPFIALGTSTGAYWSGEAVGEKIAGRYGLKKVQ